MIDAASMRVGSLEVVVALALFGVVAFRVRPASAQVVAPSTVAVRVEVEEHGRKRLFEGICPVVIGRSTGADLLVLDPEMSRRHASLEAENGTVYLTDLRSSNGTFLNERRIGESIEVRAGDRIDVGTTRMTYVGSAPWKQP